MNMNEGVPNVKGRILGLGSFIAKRKFEGTDRMPFGHQFMTDCQT